MITYGHEQYIEEAIKGVLLQKCNFKIELFIADDKSPDQTETIVQKIKKELDVYDIIKYTKNDVNLGMSLNFKSSLNKVQGKYIAICEGDDYWTDPFKLQKQVDFLENNLDYIFCVHRYKMYLENEKKFDKNIYPLNYELYDGSEKGIEIKKRYFAKDWLTQPLTALIVKDHLTEVLKLQDNFSYFRDYHTFYFLLQRGKGFCLNICSGVYRINDGGVASRKTLFEKIKTAFFIYEEMYLYTKDPVVLTNYCKFSFLLMRKMKGFNVVLKSFLYKFRPNDKFFFIKCLVKTFFNSFFGKLKRIF